MWTVVLPKETVLKRFRIYFIILVIRDDIQRKIFLHIELVN